MPQDVLCHCAAAAEWLQACYRSCQLWPALLGLAEAWSSTRDAAVVAAAVALYVQLFVSFEAPLERQEVLHSLHARLGSGVASQQDNALQVCRVASPSALCWGWVGGCVVGAGHMAGGERV